MSLSCDLIFGPIFLLLFGYGYFFAPYILLFQYPFFDIYHFYYFLLFFFSSFFFSSLPSYSLHFLFVFFTFSSLFVPIFLISFKFTFIFNLSRFWLHSHPFRLPAFSSTLVWPFYLIFCHFSIMSSFSPISIPLLPFLSHFCSPSPISSLYCNLRPPIWPKHDPSLPVPLNVCFASRHRVFVLTTVLYKYPGISAVTSFTSTTLSTLYALSTSS